MALAQIATNELKKLGYMFYVAPEEDVLIESFEQKKELTIEVIPAFVLLLLVEHLMNLWEKRTERFSTNDAITSISQGMLMNISGILNGGIGILAYIWIYDNFRIAELPWNSWLTWFVVFILVDFGYYWLHRAAHEVNIFWAGHQVHHSSEFYNLSTALRQSIIQEQIQFMVYLPLALFVPPQIFAIHKELNLLYQFWIHSQAVKSIGPLEYILNTPSHHRVHHGVNRYCIDKNYAGVLIIWDRMFGTFTAEGEDVVFGLTHNVETFDPYKVQFGYLQYLIGRFREETTWVNKLSVLFKGPGWAPGKPRLGLTEDIPDVHAPMPVWNPVVSSWVTPYSFIHYVLLILDYIALASQKNVLGNYLSLVVQSVYIFLSMTQLGAFFEGKDYAKKLELFRLTIYTLACHLLPLYSFTTRFGENSAPLLGHLFHTVHGLSFAFMLWQIIFGGPLTQETNKPEDKNAENRHKVVQSVDKSI